MEQWELLFYKRLNYYSKIQSYFSECNLFKNILYIYKQINKLNNHEN